MIREETDRPRRCCECDAIATHVEISVDDDGLLIDKSFYCAAHGEVR